MESAVEPRISCASSTTSFSKPPNGDPDGCSSVVAGAAVFAGGAGGNPGLGSCPTTGDSSILRRMILYFAPTEEQATAPRASLKRESAVLTALDGFLLTTGAADSEPIRVFLEA